MYIYVTLLDEGVDVRRPVEAEHLTGSIYRIVAQPYEREVERWEFEPGEIVVCEQIEASGGPIVAAIKRPRLAHRYVRFAQPRR